VHFVGLFLSSLLKMHGPKNKIHNPYLFVTLILIVDGQHFCFAFRRSGIRIRPRACSCSGK